MHLCIYIYPSMYPSAHVSIHLSIYLSIYPSIHPPIHPSIHRSSMYLSIRLSVCYIYTHMYAHTYRQVCLCVFVCPCRSVQALSVGCTPCDLLAGVLLGVVIQREYRCMEHRVGHNVVRGMRRFRPVARHRSGCARSVIDAARPLCAAAPPMRARVRVHRHRVCACVFGQTRRRAELVSTFRRRGPRAFRLARRRSGRRQHST
jgi:hypothetical protein